MSLTWVIFYKTRTEDNESAIPSKLSIKADVTDRQGRAITGNNASLNQGGPFMGRLVE
jgi:hypothetical protein